jgi:aminoglycoside phosphotransferase (APT) family kinase protein
MTPRPQAIEDRLGAVTGDKYVITDIRPASTGHANTTWLIGAEPRPLAIKVQAVPSVVHGRDPSLEPGVLKALAATAVPVPDLLAVDAAGDVFGAPWFAMALVPGACLPDGQLGGYAVDGWFVETEPRRRMQIWDGFVDALAALHRLPAETFGPSPRGGTHSRLLDYWAASLRDVLEPGDSPVQARAIDWLRDNAPVDADDCRRPCMGDARMANLIERDGAVVALVDWELANVGNPRADIAYHLYMDGRFSRVAGRRLSGLPTADETWRRWEERSGLAATDRTYWTVFAALIISITATRSMRIDYGFEPGDIEALNPFAADFELLLDGKEL